ncbi:tyrosine-type recombinase/integrase [Rahnella sp. C60]|uniref:tyrosine-type recombinase/integrase n=1 Tax=Rahnella perminowiae TaxID=2816244 RepID=UPI001C26648E|nr:tyrosine-type recombinase/integrase [Rahnella perminowiae]MBU9810043.1 tyrosine-type recombinase/integrase [Rahnella perminowiae]MBU9815633.1 tyrosine-type recombinase/integrase [Rahnella perminowiae]
MGKLTPTNQMLPVIQAEEDVLDRLKEFVQDREAFSPNTWRQLMSVMRICHRWSIDNRRPFLPMLPADLRDYLNWLQENGRASSTIATHGSLISMLHRNAGLTPPNASPLVFRAVKKINRVAVVTGERTGQAVPFRLEDLLELDALWSGPASLRQKRDLAFLHVAYSTLLRVSEISRLRVRDISRATDGRIILNVSYTKTIVQTGGLIKSLSSQSSHRLSEWLSLSGISTEPDAFLFCPVHRSGSATFSITRPLSTPAMESIFANAWRTVGAAETLSPNKGRYKQWTGHSARVGAAQDMAGRGYAVAQIMQEGTWKKPETLMRYIRNLQAHEGVMIDLMEKKPSGQN